MKNYEETLYMLSFSISPPATILIAEEKTPKNQLDTQNQFTFNFKKQPLTIPPSIKLNLNNKQTNEGDDVPEICIIFKCSSAGKCSSEDLCAKEDLETLSFTQTMGQDWTITKNIEETEIAGKFIGNFIIHPPDEFDFTGDYEVSFRTKNFKTIAKEGSALLSALTNFPGVVNQVASAELHKRYPVKIGGFKLEPAADIVLGQEAKLIWDVLGADKCYLDGTESNVSDARPVIVRSPQKFILSAENNLGRTAKAELQAKLKKPTIIFSAEPLQVRPNESVTLSWKVESAASITILPEPGTVSAKEDKLIVKPSESTYYTITAHGYDGTEPYIATGAVHIAVVDTATSPWKREGKANLPIDKDSLNYDCRFWQIDKKLYLCLNSNLYASTDIFRWTASPNGTGLERIITTTTVINSRLSYHFRQRLLPIVSTKKIDDVKNYLRIDKQQTEYLLVVASSKSKPQHSSPFYTAALSLSPDAQWLTSEIEKDYTVADFNFDIPGILVPTEDQDHPLYCDLGKNAWRILQFNHLCPFDYQNSRVSVLVDELKESSDGLEAIKFNGGTLFAVRNANSHLITFHSATDVTNKQTWKTWGTYEEKVDGWFRLFEIKNEIYLLYNKALIKLETLKRVSEFHPPQMGELPYTGIVNNKLFVITKDNTVWSFKP
ncbi:MAG: hypothetical protein LBH74_09450 [Nitrososphaerota archaeon]|jgi:hypothetical protein|nr:hypothetical protein [Nitrososphaerota archaeon]